MDHSLASRVAGIVPYALCQLRSAWGGWQQNLFALPAHPGGRPLLPPSASVWVSVDGVARENESRQALKTGVSSGFWTGFAAFQARKRKEVW